ncbi:MAG: hypothetical protein FWE44_06035, partial [Defluviitaleaceae bacterium]|nr:hypothetical protein [Defluviitaleaceae bacterium]
LASHMGVGGMDIEFNMGGWNVVTQMSSGVTTYIQGYIPNHGISPLAISFTYGEGTVFFTSFHNNAQATDAMINFIEYLVFRIKFIEADRTLQYLAQSHGFDYSGAVFGFFTDATARTADAATMSPNTSFETDFSTESAALSSSDFVGGGFNGGFRYNFAQGVDFLLMVDSGGQDFTLVLHDPDGNIFHITQNGEVYIVKGNPSPVPAFEAIGGLGIRISGGLGGYWTFYVMSENVDETASFAIGIATQSQ